jgi:succinate dehydrogenase/fumarate reductase cytochrome b subunit
MHTDIHALNGIRTMIPAFEIAKTIHALDRAATVIGTDNVSTLKLCYASRFAYMEGIMSVQQLCSVITEMVMSAISCVV